MGPIKFPNDRKRMFVYMDLILAFVAKELYPCSYTESRFVEAQVALMGLLAEEIVAIAFLGVKEQEVTDAQ
jgi:hypothetical protein